MLNNELLIKVAGFLSGDMLWIYFALVVLAFYLLIALFTRSFKRPLNFLGIPTIIAGLLLILSYFLISFVPIPLSDTIIKILLASVKPVLNIGIVCLVIGVVMLVIYRVIMKKKSEKDVTSFEVSNGKRPKKVKEKIAIEDSTKELK